MTDALSGPAGSGALVAAVQWVQAALLGTLATTVAVIAVAAIGLGMLTGRIHVQRGATAIMGCFILFGAPAIADGLMRLGVAAGGSNERAALSPPAPIPSQSPPSPAPYDPYAGASVPIR
ncbi:TrbC/VirB2 family protein [Sphingomonas sp.]|uniref:TrbC/VirB2 family protein n=1 Tax=Sphingomonas sp. TaxID=28214 RepID=UPI001EBA3793|nr:TrbC/VirB2 family protein [Sphingomonas sp.]